MSIVRLIHITLDPSEAENAVRVWKTECAPLMIQQKGCISEKLLRCKANYKTLSSPAIHFSLLSGQFRLFSQPQNLKWLPRLGQVNNAGR